MKLDARKRFNVAKLATPDPESGQQQTGTFSALVSVFGVLDLQGEVIDKGAFTESVDRFKAGAKVPVVWSHDYWEPDSIIGEITAMQETDLGLEVEGILDVDDNPKAATVHRQMKLGRITEFSIGGTIPEDGWRFEGKGEDTVLHITKMDLWEAGPCFKGANPDTQLLSVKSGLAQVAKEGRVLAKRYVAELAEIHTRLGKVLDAVKKDGDDDPQEPASGDESADGDQGGQKSADAPQDGAQGPSGTTEPQRLSKTVRAILGLMFVTTTDPADPGNS